MSTVTTAYTIVAPVILFIGIISPPAHAQWLARTNGPDVFGKTTVFAAASSLSKNGLVVQCNGDDELDIAFISPATETTLTEISNAGDGLPAELLIKVDSKAVHKFDAKLRAWNNSYVGIVANEPVPEIVNTIREIGTAVDVVNVGVEFIGSRQSESFGAIGSTSAMNTVIRGCKLDDIKNAAPAVSQPGASSEKDETQ